MDSEFVTTTIFFRIDYCPLSLETLLDVPENVLMLIVSLHQHNPVIRKYFEIENIQYKIIAMISLIENRLYIRSGQSTAREHLSDFFVNSIQKTKKLLNIFFKIFFIKHGNTKIEIFIKNFWFLNLDYREIVN